HRRCHACLGDGGLCYIRSACNEGVTMDPRFDSVAAEYEARAERESREMYNIPPDQMMARRDEMLLPVGRETATFLQLLIRESAARNIVEIGTSYGYSTLYLAQAAREGSGRVTTIELAAAKSQYAREARTRAGWGEHRG